MFDLTRLQECLKPLCVIQSVPHWSWSYLYKPWEIPGYKIGKEIQHFQKRVDPADWFTDSTHSRLYFDDQHIFEVTFPKAQWTTLKDIANEDLRILHYAPFDFNTHEVTIAHSVVMPLIGKWYDVVDLLAFYVAHVYAHTPEQETIVSNLIGIGKGNMVCSAGVRTGYEGLRKRLELEKDYRMKRLFPKPDGSDLTVEMTKPSDFDNHPEEFRLKACFRNNIPYYISG